MCSACIYIPLLTGLPHNFVHRIYRSQIIYCWGMSLCLYSCLGRIAFRWRETNVAIQQKCHVHSPIASFHTLLSSKRRPISKFQKGPAVCGVQKNSFLRITLYRLLYAYLLKQYFFIMGYHTYEISSHIFAVYHQWFWFLMISRRRYSLSKIHLCHI